MGGLVNSVIIRPEKATEYETVDDLIYTAFSEQHGKETGIFMKNHFMEERKKNTFIPELSLVVVFRRFGFEPSCKYGIYHKDREKWGDEGFMVCLLTVGALEGVTGTTYYYGG